MPQNLPGILWEAWEQEIRLREAFILLHEPNECTVHFFRFWSFKMSPLSEESFFFSESHTLHVIHSGTLLIFRQKPLSLPAPCGKKKAVSLDAHLQKSRCATLPAVSSQLRSQNTSARARCPPRGH